MRSSRDEIASLRLEVDQITTSRDEAEQQLLQKSAECNNLRRQLEEMTAEGKRNSEDHKIAYDELYEVTSQHAQELEKTTQELKKRNEEFSTISQELKSIQELYAAATVRLQERTSKLTETTQELDKAKMEFSGVCGQLEDAQQVLRVNDYPLDSRKVY